MKKLIVLVTVGFAFNIQATNFSDEESSDRDPPDDYVIHTSRCDPKSFTEAYGLIYNETPTTTLAHWVTPKNAITELSQKLKQFKNELEMLDDANDKNSCKKLKIKKRIEACQLLRDLFTQDE
jgi:hypothetical protein